MYSDASGVEGGYNSCIVLILSSVYWDAAETYCPTLGSGVHLLTSNSLSGVLGIGANLASAASVPAWVGAVRASDQSPWQWVDGTPFSSSAFVYPNGMNGDGATVVRVVYGLISISSMCARLADATGSVVVRV